jgi:hypothetical protein
MCQAITYQLFNARYLHVLYIRNNKNAVRRCTAFIAANVKAATYVCCMF